MRAVYVLAVVLSFVTPQVSRTAIELARDASASISLAAPSATSQLVRAVAARTDKTFSNTGAISIGFVSLFPPIGSLVCVAAQTCDAPHLDLEGPPLAPRPPPSL
ncbi:MAG: hypothetical protein K2Y23_26615 [Cyanobacteria bacterium]|nr:hypothetical protein [Cyanobacteriota bacterium]